MSPTRRQYLAALSGTGIAVLAGCSDGSPTTTSASSTTTTAERTPSTTTTLPPTAATPGPTTTETPTATTTTPTVDVEALRADARTLVTQLGDGEYEAVIGEHRYTDQVAAQLDAASLEEIWIQQTGDLGTFTGIADTQYATSQGFHVLAVTAQFTDGQQPVRLVYDGQSRIAGIQFPQRQQNWTAPDYADPSSFTEQSVTLQATDSCSLPGTITVPTGEGPVPGVVLVSGSGPTDRDSTIGPNKPLKDLAWGLASRGVAVLRYEKRTAACQVDPATITLDEEVTDDALTAVRRLREHERVRDSDAVVVGHSLGGMVAPRIAAQASDLAGIAMLAAPARPLWELLVEQTRYLAELDGTVTDAEQRQLDQVETQVQRIEDMTIQQGEVVLGGGRPYWQSLHAYDQVAVAQDLTLPRLLVQGGRDYQVTVEADFQRWKAALGDSESVTVREYPDLNHLLMPGEGRSSPQEYYRPDNVAQSLVADLAEWVAGVSDV